MVHEKYIKRDGKVFGPYLYENYRENGKMKTRYLGLGKSKKSKNWIFIFGGILISILVISLIGIFLSTPYFLKTNPDINPEELASNPFLDRLISPFIAKTSLGVYLTITQIYPPIIFADDKFFVCENSKLEESFYVNSSQQNISEGGVSMNPLNPFFILNSSAYNSTRVNFILFSDILTKAQINNRRVANNNWAIYPETLTATDGIYVDSKNVEITIIEVNNPPQILNPPGVKTIWTWGPKNNFYYRANVSDLETSSSNLVFNLSFNGEVPIFKINNQGIINFTANSSHLGILNSSKTYNLTLCVNDTALPRPHARFNEFCWQQGYSSKQNCTNFSLTITNINTPPNITSYYPNNNNKTINVTGTLPLYFNITYYDEQGTIPDVYWYYNDWNVDPILMHPIKLEQRNFSSELNYNFPCGVGGTYMMYAFVTDGDLNDSIFWHLNVQKTECPIPPPETSSGGGGGGKIYCREQWGCKEWGLCNNLEQEYVRLWVQEDYDSLKKRCGLFNYSSQFCGFQIRTCNDLNYCNSSFSKPGVLKECYYTENPSCEDGIINCHNDSCEVLTDCGGPCVPCPTCSDKIQNQGEEGVDCGSPCEKNCLEYAWVPNFFKSLVLYSLILLGVLLFILTASQIRRYVKFKKEERRTKQKRIIEKAIMNKAGTILIVLLVLGLLLFANVFILNTPQSSLGISSPGSLGFLANYGLLNSVFSNMGIFLNAFPIVIPPENATLGYEDILLIYNISNNASDPGDVLTFQIEKINDGINLQDYPWIKLDSEGLLTINSTKEPETGNFKLSIKILDSDNQGPVVNFYFNISAVNDAPYFIGLDNKTLITGDLFNYDIDIGDEESNTPYVINISFISCSESLGGNCNLFGPLDYSLIGNRLVLNFIPANSQNGTYLINFSVMDNSSLGNKTTSQIVNFSVELPIWDSLLNQEYNLVEDTGFYLNLSENVTNYFGEVTFSAISTLPSFDITSEGVINFTPEDSDVGFWQVEITANTNQASSSKSFNFTIDNVNDRVDILSLQGNGISFLGGLRNLTAYENSEIDLFLFVEDNDLLISRSQKSFYDEMLTLNLTIEGLNSSLFSFDAGEIFNENQIKFTAMFKPTGIDNPADYYNITINVRDSNGSFDEIKLNLTILDRNYDAPKINSPNSSVEFSFFEGTNYTLQFNASHTVGDDLRYEFYVNGSLRESLMGPGDGSYLDWNFMPNYSDETHGNKILLTLNVSNLFLSRTQSWNLTINHSNAPVTLIDNIDDMEFDYKVLRELNLSYHFFDLDHIDPNYLQNLSFNISSNSSPSYITTSEVLDDWTVRFSSSKSAPFNETLIITAYDLDLEDPIQVLSNVTSNYFIVNIVEPAVVSVPQPSSGGDGATIPVSLKIISPGEISGYELETITLPIQLINSGKKAFNDLNLNVSAFKDGSIVKQVEASLDKVFFKTLPPGKQENLTLQIFFNTNKTGKYEVLIQAKSNSPKYTDWEKIYINLAETNESGVRNLIIFTEELIAQNPQCIEIKENLNEAENLLEKGDFVGARLKTEEVLNSCKKSISQVSIPRPQSDLFKLGIYLFLSIIGALILGITYYLFKRWKFQRINKVQKTNINQSDKKI